MNDQIALIQGEIHAVNKGKMTGRYQFDTQLTEIGLKTRQDFPKMIQTLQIT